MPRRRGTRSPVATPALCPRSSGVACRLTSSAPPTLPGRPGARGPPGCSPWFELAAPAAERTGISTKIRCATPHDVRRAFASYLHEEARISSDRVGLVMDRATSDLPHVTDDNGMARRYTRDEILALKAKTELKAQLVAEHRRQRGIGDAAAERARRRSASAKAHAEGRTTRQRQRRGPVAGAEPA